MKNKILMIIGTAILLLSLAFSIFAFSSAESDEDKMDGVIKVDSPSSWSFFSLEEIGGLVGIFAGISTVIFGWRHDSRETKKMRAEIFKLKEELNENKKISSVTKV